MSSHLEICHECSECRKLISLTPWWSNPFVRLAKVIWLLKSPLTYSKFILENSWAKKNRSTANALIALKLKINFLVL
jgi:hypothetical protein